MKVAELDKGEAEKLVLFLRKYCKAGTTVEVDRGEWGDYVLTVTSSNGSQKWTTWMEQPPPTKCGKKHERNSSTCYLPKDHDGIHCYAVSVKKEGEL